MSNAISDAAQRKSFWQTVAYGVAGCLAISAAAYFLGISPAIAHLAERQAEMDELAARRQRVAEARADLVAARTRLSQAQQEVAALPLRLEPASVVNLRLNRLAEVASASNVALNEMQPQPAIDGQHYQIVPIRVTGSGSYPACAAFLHSLRTQFPDTAVQAVEAINSSPGRQGNVATFRLDLAWHTAPAKK